MAQTRSDLLSSPSFSATSWQMSFGERAVIEGVLAQLRPRLSIEIGTAEGGSLRRIAEHSERAISFDLVEPEADVQSIDNVELRTGDSHQLLRAELEDLAAQGETVDFVLVDGDHSAEGARRDMLDLLRSDAVESTVVLAHDTLNQEVRRGLEQVPYREFDKVAYVDLDFIGGYVPREPPLRGECWGGLGLVIVDGTGSFAEAHAGLRPAMTPLSELIWPVAESMRGGAGNGAGARRLQEQADDYRRALSEIESSASWRLTAPLRSIKRRLRARLR
jgi:Methyltransferase domain